MTTPNLALQQVPSNSLQPSVPINDALQVLDALVQLSVQTIVAAPPATVAGDVGKRWIVGAAATGAWVGKDGQVALCTAAGAWRFFTPAEGWRADVRDVDKLYRYSGTGWAEVSVSGAAAAPAVTALVINAGVVNIDLSLGRHFTLTLTANVTSVTFSNLPAAGYAGEFALRILQDATGGRTVALPASFKATGGSDTAVASAANAHTLLTAMTFDQGARWAYAMQDIAA